MAMVEIDETELANYRQLAETHNKALRDPKSRSLLIDALAEVNPQIANAPDRILRREIAERDQAITTKIDEFIAESRKEREERAQREQVAALERNMADGRRVARASGYTEDGLKALEDFKAEHGILDYEDAIAAYERRNPPPTPVATGTSRWDFLNIPQEELPDIKPLLESGGRDENWLGKTIEQTLRQVRQG